MIECIQNREIMFLNKFNLYNSISHLKIIESQIASRSAFISENGLEMKMGWVEQEKDC